MPIGRGSGTGVNSSTRFPYPRGAFSKGEGGMNFCGGEGEEAGSVMDGFEAAFSASLAKRLYEVLKVRHWHSRHRSCGLLENDMMEARDRSDSQEKSYMKRSVEEAHSGQAGIGLSFTSSSVR